MIKVDTRAVDSKQLEALLPELRSAQAALWGKTGAGSDFTGWVTLPNDYDRDEFSRIQSAAERIKSDSQVLLVVGIGGSYLGARAVIDFLQSSFYMAKKKDTPDVIFIGNNLSGTYLQNVIDIIGARDFSVNVISKSGTTTEPAVAFRILKKLCEQRYGSEGAKKRIYATTDKARGALKGLADSAGYETFVIPDDVGGRYSVLTAVGLLPIAVAGIDIEALMAGGTDMMKLCRDASGLDNPAWAYAAARSALYRAGKGVEVLACYDPDFVFMAEWWKQLYGESEGKDGKGLFPAAVSFTADLHSMGQYIQQGVRNLMETVVVAKTPAGGLTVEPDPSDADGLNFLAGKTLDEINFKAYQGTLLAHTDGGVPCLTIDMGEKSARSLGELIYFFEYACGLSGYMLGVNPFDQPGVEDYKKNMFALLHKPGYEARAKELEARL